jgi:hypothetical protein
MPAKHIDRFLVAAVDEVAADALGLFPGTAGPSARPGDASSLPGAFS